MGFLDGLAKSTALWGEVQVSKDENGKLAPIQSYWNSGRYGELFT